MFIEDSTLYLSNSHCVLIFYPLNLARPIDIMRNSVFVSYVGVKK